MAQPAEKIEEFAESGEDQYVEIGVSFDGFEDGFEAEVEQEILRERVERLS